MKKYVKYIGIGIGAIVLALSGLAVFTLFTTNAPVKITQDFVMYMASENYEAAYAMASEEFKAATPMESFVSVISSTRLSELSDFSVSSRSIGTTFGETISTVSGSVSYGDGTKARTSTDLIKENGDWYVLFYDMENAKPAGVE